MQDTTTPSNHNSTLEIDNSPSNEPTMLSPPPDVVIPPQRTTTKSTSNLPSGPKHRRGVSEMSQAVSDWATEIACAGWCTRWEALPELKEHYPARHSDFRDSLPDDMATVYRLYSPYVSVGMWTFGLLEMWFPRAKAVKHAVHVPCWDSYKVNPCLWRGIAFGRTMKQCFYVGIRQMRWSRAVYAAGLGHEYVYPVYDVGRHGYLSSLKALCWLYCCMGCLFGCGIGQVFSLCGNSGCNFGACYSCHARERLRRKYKLPSSFGMPPGIDDCLVHFFCFYCASHQELRELAVRGVDGPGMHVFDVVPEAFLKLPGGPEAVEARKALVDEMLKRGPRVLRVREKKMIKKAIEERQRQQQLAEQGEEAEGVFPPPMPSFFGAGKHSREVSTDSVEALGWIQYRPPFEQEMIRDNGAGRQYGPSPRVVVTLLPRAQSF